MKKLYEAAFLAPLARLRGVIPILVTAAFATCAGLAPNARADVIYNYVFSPGAGYANASTGDAASLSGTFSWDATTSSVVASHISLSGTDASGSAPGAVSCSNCTTGIYGSQYFAINLGPQALYTIFANSLSVGATDALALECCGFPGNGAEYQGGDQFTAVTGSALLATAAPEPAGLAIFGSALFGLGLIMRRRRYDA